MGTVEEWLVRAFQGASSTQEAGAFVARHVAERHDVQVILDGLAKAAAGRPLVSVRRAPLPSIITASFGSIGDGVAGAAIECVLDDSDRLLGIQPAPDGVELTVASSDALSPSARDALQRLFAIAYDEADSEYLDRSLTTLPWVSMASAEGELVGFSLGDLRELDLPGVGPTPCLLAGLACVDPRHRRHGLFRYLSNLSLRAAGVPPPDRVALGAGRMAHPASMRMVAVAPTLVPKPGVRPSPLQRAVGQCVADAYGVTSFDPETFVCRGSGRPIGFPKMRQDVEPHEWEVFEPVDRSRGDSLLALVWHGDPPDGW
jgi:hypothetical protein